jgi:hypothetical protein
MDCFVYLLKNAFKSIQLPIKDPDEPKWVSKKK